MLRAACAGKLSMEKSEGRALDRSAGEEAPPNIILE
jgi:hypothetical protein